MRNQNARLSTYTDLLYLIVLVGCFYSIGLGSFPLFTPDEGRYSEVAREMVALQDYVTPRLNGIAFLDKPILYYWLQTISIRLFGVSEWALRFFPMLSGLLLIASTYCFARYIFDRKTALLSAGVLATSPLIFGTAHYANLDLEVALFITTSLYLGVIALLKTSFSRLALYGAIIAAGLAVLTKGLIGLFFPIVILGVMLIYCKAWSLLSLRTLFISIALFTSIVLPWFIAVQIQNPQFFHYFFVTQHITRFLSQAEFNNQTPFWFYLPVVFLGFFPWSVFLYHAIKGAIQSAIHDLTKRTFAIFLLLFASVVLVFFSIPHSKMVGYILPVFPPLSILVGWYLSTHWTALINRRYRLYAFLSVLVSTMVLLLSLPFIAPVVNTQSTKAFAHTIKPLLTAANSEVITYFDYFYDLPLYLGKTVKVVADWQDPALRQRDNWRRELALGAPFHHDPASILLNEDAFWNEWYGDKRLFVMMFVSDFAAFKQKTQHYHILKEGHGMVLVSNRT